MKNPGVAERAVGYLDHADRSHGRIVAVDGSPLVAKKLQMVVIITYVKNLKHYQIVLGLLGYVWLSTRS